jgi:hypothetical protein
MAQHTSTSAAPRSARLSVRGAVALALLGAGASLGAGCGVDFKVAVAGLPVEPSVSALLVSVDSGDRRADSASPLPLSGFSAEQRADFADRFTFPLDITGLAPVSKNARISVAAVSYTDGKPCIQRSGSTDAAAQHDNPTYAEVVVPLLPPVQGTMQQPSAAQFCGREGPIVLGVRREFKGSLNASSLKLYINGWGFGLKNKVTLERCDLTFNAGVPGCAVDRAGAAIDARFYRVDSIGKASIVVTFLSTFSEQSVEVMRDLLAFLFPLRITVEAQDAAGASIGQPAVYIEPKPGFDPM